MLLLKTGQKFIQFIKYSDASTYTTAVVGKLHWEYCFLTETNKQDCEDKRVTTLPCVWCEGTCPIPLLRCLQEYKVEDRCFSYWCDRCGLKISVTNITIAMLNVSWEDFSVGKDGMEKTPKSKDLQLKSKKKKKKHSWTTVLFTQKSWKQIKAWSKKF